MMNRRAVAMVAALALAAVWAGAEAPASTLPVREVAAFKDGHAFVVQEGTAPVDSAGHVVLDGLPNPVLGTFWPYSGDPNVTLTSVTAGRRRVAVERAAVALAQIIEANAGASCTIQEQGAQDPQQYAATLLGLLQREVEEDPAAAPVPAGEGFRPPESPLVKLKTEAGTRFVPLSCVRDITFQAEPKANCEEQEWRNELTLAFKWQTGTPPTEARVGYTYLQKGLRWIPSYKVTLVNDKEAKVELQATLVNDLIDLENITVRLVVGAPSFQFQDISDPIALQDTLAQIAAQASRQRSSGPAPSPFASALSNTIMTQVAMPVDAPAPPQAAEGGVSEFADTAKREDLFVFTLEGVTLKRGQRAAFPVATYTLPFEHVFALTIDALPPAELGGSAPDAVWARQAMAPKVMHQIRLTNPGPHPLTTAPALILQGDAVLAQGLMTYTPAGSRSEIDVTAAVDIQVIKEDAELQRIPNAARWQMHTFQRVDLAGKLRVTSFRAEPVTIEITRIVHGKADSASLEGEISMINVFEEREANERDGHRWWYGLPWWWYHFNGMAKIQWHATLEPKKELALEYTWHYFWE